MQYIIAITIGISCSQGRAISCLEGYILKPEVIIPVHVYGYYPFIICACTFHVQRTSVYDRSTRLAGFSPVIGRIEATFYSGIAGDIRDRIVYGIGTDSQFDERIITCS
jgi:hypothetical protein